MTKYVVSGYIGFDNFGDEAIASVLTSHLKSLNAEKITLISSNPLKTSSLYGVDAVGMLDFINAIRNSDVLISGGGSLLQDITSLKSLLYYLSIIFTALTFDKKVIIFAQGFTPFRTKIGKWLTKFVLKRCEKITVRDNKSQELLKDMGINSILVSDPAYGLSIPQKEKNGVGIQLRNCAAGISEDFLDDLANQINKRFKGKNIKLISLQDEIDLPVLENFASKVNGTIKNNLTVKEAIDEISELEYLIGMRFHSCLVGAKAGVKILGINYDVKVKTLANNINFPIIELNKPILDKSFDDLTELNTKNYKISDFSFKDIL